MDNYLNLTSGIEYQDENGMSNFCTSYACSQAVESLFNRVYGKTTKLSNIYGMMLSKKTDKRPEATGTSIENIMNEICKNGISPIEFYPDKDANVNDNSFNKPSEKAVNEAKRFRPGGWLELKTAEHIDEAIEKYGSVVFIVRVYPSHLNPINGYVRQPRDGEHSNGLHAIFCSGKTNHSKHMNGRDEKGFYILDESYSAKRGFKGRLYIPKRYFTEKVTSKYSYETYIDKAYCFTWDEEMPYVNINDKNEVPVPCKEIKLKIGEKSFVEKGRTFVELRYLSEQFGAGVYYTKETQAIRIFSSEPNYLINMNIASKTIEKSLYGKNTKIEMDVMPVLKDGKTYIPLRAFAEAIGCSVDYANGIINIKYML
ncbi:MAG: stalk domain-containing protein [Bacilli bacterium]